MAIESFGKTWWGEQWLASLTNIDYSNRLPRGKTYARKGRVSELEIKNGKIIAYVDGSRSRPYKVTLWMDKFDKKTMNVLVDKIMEFPTTVSKLLNGKMDPLLFMLAEEVGLHIFPAESKDMGMKCSCPDWAVPCKHIAAVIYKVCKDIDNNPFVLFQFRDTDLVELLLQKNIDVYAYQKQSIDQYDVFIEQNIYVKQAEYQAAPIADLSQLNDRSEEFFHLLEANPPFFPYGDFKEIYKTKITKIQKDIARVLTYKKPLSFYFDEKKQVLLKPILSLIVLGKRAF